MSAEFGDDGVDRPSETGTVDMFTGEATPYRDPRGRPKLKVTNELRDRVAVLRASGMERQEIADAIGCCKKTLETYFLPSLNEGRWAKVAEAKMKLYQLGVIEGNVTALKAFIALTERNGFVPPVPGKPKEPKLGKKDLLARDAEIGHHESEWGDVLH
jgi:hypothetical protein